MNKQELAHPNWLKIKLPGGEEFKKVKLLLDENKLSTVCVEARCPNKSECWGNGVFTFMILGEICTRNCKFCAVTSGIPNSVDLEEPRRVAEVVKSLNSKYIVITSVDRDDLPDGGAGIYAETIDRIKRETPECKVEVLIPDFSGKVESLDIVLKAKPDVLAHNVETVPSLYSKVRIKSDYQRSLKVLEYSKSKNFVTKSGVMLGLGETENELFQLMDDLINIGCDIFTIGQYLQPTKKQLPIEKYYSPEEFEKLKEKALQYGFKKVESGPLVRSSYHAERSF